MIELSNAIDIVTLSQIKNYLELWTTVYDSRLTAILSAMTLEMEKYCGRILRKANIVETYFDPFLNLSNDNEIKTQEFPIISVDSISTVYDGSETIIEDSEYVVIKDRGKIRLTNSVSTWLGADRATIAYTSGWDVAPYDLQEILIQLVQMRFEQGNTSTANRGPVKFERVDGAVSVSYDTSGMVGAASKGFRVDPILGQFATNLDYYRSDRVLV
jgi:hypothetical protein